MKKLTIDKTDADAIGAELREALSRIQEVIEAAPAGMIRQAARIAYAHVLGAIERGEGQ